MHYGCIQERVLDAHEKLLSLQKAALQFPSSPSFEAVAAQDVVLSELSTIEEDFLKQKFRVKWLNEGDHNSKYFHRVLKGKQTKMRILTLQNDKELNLSEEKDIISEFLKFYMSFLGTADLNCTGRSKDFFQSLQLARLTPKMKCSLLSEVTIDEILNTLKGMPRNKSPRPDRYSVEFFLAAWEVVRSLFVAPVNFSGQVSY